jgi:choice-of-anchor A domain-containing protein
VRHPIIAAAALAVTAFASAAQADTAKDYNLFVLHNMNAPSSDVEGRAAVGGNATISSYSVSAKSSASGVNFVVGGDLAAKGGSANGKVVVGGTTNTSYVWNNILPSSTPIPVNFNAEAARLGNLAKMLDGYTNTGTVNYVTYGGANSHGTQITLNGNNAGLNVFDLDGAKLSDTNTFTITLKPGSTALINVSGTSDLWSNAGLTIKGGDASSILWNFADATTLGFSNIGLLGSVLAPNANFVGSGGQINGQMIVGSFNGTTQVNNVSFVGDLLGLTPTTTGAVPEPAVWVMMVGGFGLVGAMLRRRRRSAVADFA